MTTPEPCPLRARLAAEIQTLLAGPCLQGSELRERLAVLGASLSRPAPTPAQPRASQPAAVGNPWASWQPRVTFTRDLLAAEYMVRCEDTGALADAVRDLSAWECRRDLGNRCWHVASWAVEGLADALRQKGCEVVMKL